MIDVEVVGADAFGHLARRLRAQSPQLRKALLADVRSTMRPAVGELRAAIRALPVSSSHGGGGKARAAYRVGRARSASARTRAARRPRGLREAIAAGVQLKVSTSGQMTGVRIRIDRSGLPPDQRGLPGALDRPAGWRHPTFGHAPWVTQRGRPYFDVTLRPYKGRLQRQLLDLMDAYAAKLTGER